MAAVTPTILVDGKALNSSVGVISIDIRKEVNRIPQAELRIADGSVAQRKFAVSDAGTFSPGAEVEIKLRYEGQKDTSLFKGVVVRQGIESTLNRSSLVVGLKDKAVKLTSPRSSAVFQKMTDADIVKKLIEDGGLKAGKIEATKPEHPEMVQYSATSWDFILSRADAHGLLVIADAGEIAVAKAEIKGEAAHTFDHGISDILDFEIEADAGHQLEGVESVAWDPAEQKLTDPTQAVSVTAGPGDFDGEKLGKSVGGGKATLTHAVPVSADELKAWADARLLRSRLSLYRGRISVKGLPGVKLLDVIKIDGVGKHYNGKTLVTGLSHRYGAGGWRTDVQFGLSPETFSRSEAILDAPAAGLLPAVTGLQIGVVAAFEADPDNELRVKVILPGVDKEDKAIWARLASPDAGKDRGYYFRPEPEDEVVVGFFNNDPRYPVILGSLYSSKNTQPAAVGDPDDKNEKKGIVTKKGTTIGFTDADKASIFIETPNKNKLTLDDDAEQITIEDQHGNKITMSKDGVSIKSAKDLKIEADGNVEIKGSKVDVK